MNWKLTLLLLGLIVFSGFVKAGKTAADDEEETPDDEEKTPDDETDDKTDDKKAASECKDKNAPGRASDCPIRKDLCKNPVYEQLMKEQCPTSCQIGKCGKKDDKAADKDKDAAAEKDKAQRRRKNLSKKGSKSKPTARKTKANRAKSGKTSRSRQ